VGLQVERFELEFSPLTRQLVLNRQFSDYLIGPRLETPSSSKVTTMFVVGFIFVILVMSLASDVEDVRTGATSIITFFVKAAFALLLPPIIYQVYKNYKKSLAQEKAAAVSSLEKIREQAINITLAQEKRDSLLFDAQRLAVDKPTQLTYLGGSGLDLTKQTSVLMFLNSSILSFIDHESIRQTKINFLDITNIEVSGPGTETTNAGISGGGFGIAGFIQGAAAAALINTITSRSTTNTFLRILGTSMEGYFHTGMMNPDQLKLVLSPLVVSIEKKKHQSAQTAPAASLADEISKLNLLVKDGAITSEEFAAAKKKLIER
jgi:hypothetical protein